jgi:hypothetical protein
MDFDVVFLIDGVIQKEGLYVYNIRNTVEKYLSIAPVGSYRISLVYDKSNMERIAVIEY